MQEDPAQVYPTGGAGLRDPGRIAETDRGHMPADWQGDKQERS